MLFEFSQHGNKVCIKTKKQNKYSKINYFTIKEAKKTLKMIKKYNWKFEIKDEYTKSLL